MSDLSDKVRVWQQGRHYLWEIRAVGEPYQGGGTYSLLYALEQASYMAIAWHLPLVANNIICNPCVIRDSIAAILSQEEAEP